MIVRMPNGETVEFPEGTPTATVQRAIRGYLEERNAARGTGERVARGAGMVGQGFNEGLAQTVGALPDLVGAGMRGLGIPNAPRAGFYTDAVRSGIESITGAPQVPETPTERALQGAGRGVADAASVLIPATAVARTAQVGGMAQRAGQALAAQPAMQVAAGAVGGAVGDATDSPLLGTAAAIATPLAASVARRVVTPLPIAPERQPMIDTAAREGIPLTPGQASGNSAARFFESSLRDLPTTATRQRGIENEGQRAFNRAVLSRAGIQGDSAMPDVLTANRDRLGNEFQRISAATTVRFDPAFVTDMGTAVQRYGVKLPVAQRPVFEGFVREILLDPATGAPRVTMTGEMYQQARSDIERLRRSYQQNDPALSDAMRQLRNALDNAMGRSVAPELRADWQQARRQWGNQRTVERAITAGENVAEGNISPASLRGAINNYDPSSYALGRGELSELARLGQGAMRAPPQSGTAPRHLYTAALTGTGVATMDPLSVLGAAAIPRAVQEIYNSGVGQRYLRNQLAPGGVTTPNLLTAIGAQQGLAEGRAAVTGSR